MTNERKLAVVIAVLALALPITSYYSFRVGYKLWPEVHGYRVYKIPAR